MDKFLMRLWKKSVLKCKIIQKCYKFNVTEYKKQTKQREKLPKIQKCHKFNVTE